MDDYKNMCVVGRGTFGLVHLCERRSDHKQVIIKHISLEHLSGEDQQTTRNEVKVLSILSHPNILEYYHSFVEDLSLAIVMEYAPGGTLQEFLRQRNEELLSQQAVVNLFCQLLLATQHIHSKKILHRDIKTANILLTRNKDFVKLGDFGISKILASKSKAETVVGTPCYLSPELCEGRPYNEKSDIWALGCVLYEMMTLHRAFQATTLTALVVKIVNISYEPILGSKYEPSLHKLVSHMLRSNPENRPTVEQLMSDSSIVPVLYPLRVNMGAILCDGHKRHSPVGLSMSQETLSSRFVNVTRDSLQ